MENEPEEEDNVESLGENNARKDFWRKQRTNSTIRWVFDKKHIKKSDNEVAQTRPKTSRMRDNKTGADRRHYKEETDGII